MIQIQIQMRVVVAATAGCLAAALLGPTVAKAQEPFDVFDAELFITTVAGSDTYGYAGDGGPAVYARLERPTSLTVAPDGTVYFVSRQHRLHVVGVDGTATRVDHVQRFADASDLAVGQDDVLYVADGGASGSASFRVLAVDPDTGVISVFAGSGWHEPNGDGNLARNAGFGSLDALAVGPDGTVYIADDGNTVRAVDPDGTIRTAAGSATEAELDEPIGLAVGPDGTLFIADSENYRVRAVGDDPTVPGPSFLHRNRGLLIAVGALLLLGLAISGGLVLHSRRAARCVG